MRASRFIHTAGLTAALVAAVLFAVLEGVRSRYLEKHEVRRMLKKDAPGDVEQTPLPLVQHEAEPAFENPETRPWSMMPEHTAAQVNFASNTVDPSERLRMLLSQKRQYDEGRMLDRMSDVMLPFIGIDRDGDVASSDQQDDRREIDMSSAFLQKLFRLRSDDTWMDNLPVLGVTVGLSEEESAYALKGFEFGLPGKALWLVHEPQDEEHADATYLKLRASW